MGRVPSFLMRHTVTVLDYQGEGGVGPILGPPVEVKCWIDDKRRIVRNASGEQVVAESTFVAPPGTAVKAGDRVVINGRATEAIAVSVFDSRGLAAPDNVEVACA